MLIFNTSLTEHFGGVQSSRRSTWWSHELLFGRNKPTTRTPTALFHFHGSDTDGESKKVKTVCQFNSVYTHVSNSLLIWWFNFLYNTIAIILKSVTSNYKWPSGDKLLHSDVFWRPQLFHHHITHNSLSSNPSCGFCLLCYS